MTNDKETLAIIILNIHPAYTDLYKNASIGSWRWREWGGAMQIANKIVEAGFSSVRLNV